MILGLLGPQLAVYMDPERALMMQPQSDVKV